MCGVASTVRSWFRAANTRMLGWESYLLRILKFLTLLVTIHMSLHPIRLQQQVGDGLFEA